MTGDRWDLLGLIVGVLLIAWFYVRMRDAERRRDEAMPEAWRENAKRVRGWRDLTDLFD